MVISNARLVLHDEVVTGSLHHEDGIIASIDTGVTGGGEDFGGDFLMPGFVELHTDNFERHVIPRPETYWPNLLAAAITHDAELAAAGITTVFDSLCIGAYHGENSPRRQLFAKMVGAIVDGSDKDVFRIDHRLHFRCELTDPGLMELLLPISDTRGLSLVSLMDHTPGQRQWSDIDKLRTFNSRSEKSAVDVEQMIQQRIEMGQRHVPDNRRAVLTHFSNSSVTLASHDDTTLEHVNEAVQDGIKISEFPCSLDAAVAAAEQGMYTLGGAPNVVRGGSHSGNVAVEQLAREDILHGLSSDYVPSSLLQAAMVLVNTLSWSLPSAIRLISANPAEMVGMHDRGRLEAGRRADLLRVAMVGDTPIIKAVYRLGERVL